MKTPIYNLSQIFNNSLFRIPDFQRGYAWQERQLKDFWRDINNLKSNKSHYAGVLTLEDVSRSDWETWEDDRWIIETKRFKPYYVVDGQQRLTTSLILLQCLIEAVESKGVDEIVFEPIKSIKSQFISTTKDKGISYSYIFGYCTDDPSYQFLKKIVLNGNSEQVLPIQETAYTANLSFAKNYFKERIEKMTIEQIENIFNVLTKQFVFNCYTIAEEVDVYVAFETMNNRGKPLSHLEILKNRLIYLSTKFEDDAFEVARLRKKINETWKAVYYFLGRNKDNPLPDDVFLKNHFATHFILGKLLELFYPSDEEVFEFPLKYTTKEERYNEYILDYIFVEDSIISKKLSINIISNYTESLKSTVELWYKIFNPYSFNLDNENIQLLVQKINRIAQTTTRSYFDPASTLFAILQKIKPEDAEQVLIEYERFLFIASLMDSWELRYIKATVGQEAIYVRDESNIISKAWSDCGASDLAKFIKMLADTIASSQPFQQRLLNMDGNFYGWAGIRYFLYEYEQFLSKSSKTSREKIEWDDFINSKSDYYTVEHIYPQKAQGSYWRTNFTGFNQKQRDALKHTLGNLLPLSRAKNSSFQNKSFPDKKGTKLTTIGYAYGGYSENEVALHDDWKPEDILERGIKLLSFMERRWSFRIGDAEKKKKVLGLSFLNK